MEHNVITECVSNKNAKDLIIYIYKMKLSNFQEKHTENYKKVQKLRKVNNWQVIVFYEQLIGSFQEIKNWDDLSYAYIEKRAINIENKTERELLERLILRNIENAQLKKEITAKLGEFKSNKCIAIVDGVKIYPSIKIDINILDNGEIIAGFDYKHSFAYEENLHDFILKGKIGEGDRVIDDLYGYGYSFMNQAEFTISETNKYMNTSILEYYKSKNQEFIIKNINPQIKAVLVKSSNNDILPYIPTLLRKECSYANLPPKTIHKINPYIKLGANEKMNKAIEFIIKVLEKFQLLTWEKPNMITSSLGYKVINLKQPLLTFGKGIKDTRVFNGLTKGGTFENKQIEISYFLDPDIIELFNKKHPKSEKTKKFTEDLDTLSNNLGVKIKKVQLVNIYKNKKLSFNEQHDLSVKLKEITCKFKKPTVVIAMDNNIDKCYGIIKKEFGNKNCIPTQFFKVNKVDLQGSSREYTILNILLGIYSKAGIQPWILSQKLNTDCLIGIDVSHENKKHSAGTIQVVGKDGRVIKSKALSSAQSGEQVSIETMNDIIYEAFSSFKKKYGVEPKHFTFHRDGRCFEDIENMRNTLSKLGVQFDYVEIIKNSNRRMATTNEFKTWRTVMGRCYIKNDTAYLCSTNPQEKVGMAKPLKIRKVFGVLPIETIVKDIYDLSFMHIASLIKTRLPITTHYADLSSTYSNRQWIPTNMDSRTLHFV